MSKARDKKAGAKDSARQLRAMLAAMTFVAVVDGEARAVTSVTLREAEDGAPAEIGVEVGAFLPARTPVIDLVPGADGVLEAVWREKPAKAKARPKRAGRQTRA